jgi:hypothetical protein
MGREEIMPILISKTYEIITKESARNGDAQECGFEYEDQPFSFRDLLNEVRKFEEYTGDWLTQYGSQNYHDGSYTNYSLHFSRSNKPRMKKYWDKAIKAANI